MGLSPDATALSYKHFFIFFMKILRIAMLLSEVEIRFIDCSSMLSGHLQVCLDVLVTVVPVYNILYIHLQ